MTRLSLRIRSFAAALLALLIFIPVTGIIIERAFTESLSQSMLERLRISSLSLLSTFELRDNAANLPELLLNDQFNVPGSGVYAFVQMNGETIWQSMSTLNWQTSPSFSAPPLGEEMFIRDFELVTPYFLYGYSAEFENDGEFVPVSFYVLQDRFSFDNEREQFSSTLWYSLALIAFLLLALLLVSLNTALSPINKLIARIREAEAGQLTRIRDAYPPELEKLKSSINHLLDSEQQQRTRYKNSLSDLAHSLKTPLSVLSGTESLPRSAREPIRQLENIIQRQLKRAVAGGGSGWEQPELVEPIVAKLRNAMTKVHAQKGLDIQMDVDVHAQFRGDKTDLMELLGNIMDNACKAAKGKVQIQARQTELGLTVEVHDDGPGIASEHREDLLNRGVRLDSYQEGQGIGMAIASDLVSAYQGQLQILDSHMGGALIRISFNIPAAQ